MAKFENQAPDVCMKKLHFVCRNWRKQVYSAARGFIHNSVNRINEVYVLARSDAERVSLRYNILQLNDDVYVHLMNLDYAYVTLVLLGLEDDATSLLLGHQSQRFRYLCMSGLHKIWSKVSRYTH